LPRFTAFRWLPLLLFDSQRHEPIDITLMPLLTFSMPPLLILPALPLPFSPPLRFSLSLIGYARYFR